MTAIVLSAVMRHGLNAEEQEEEAAITPWRYPGKRH